MPYPKNYIRTLETKRWLVKCDTCEKEYDIFPDYKRTTVECKQCMLKKKNTTHNMSNTRLYKIWTDMKKRCDNKSHAMYSYYGGSGISYQDDWSKFESFYNWASNNGYNDELEIDRINGNQDYCEENCRWETRSHQMQNTRKIWKHNTSGYRGVSLKTGTTDRFISQISVNGNKKYIGCYESALAAAVAYDEYVMDNDLFHTTNF
jgi:hypothetical protein